MSSQDVIVVALSVLFLLIVLTGGLGMAFYANRIINWSERTFTPSLQRTVKSLYGEDYRPTGTPAVIRMFVRWFLRFAGTAEALGSSWVLYFIVSNMIGYLNG